MTTATTYHYTWTATDTDADGHILWETTSTFSVDPQTRAEVIENLQDGGAEIIDYSFGHGVIARVTVDGQDVEVLVQPQRN